jgi:hypothetical protein
MSARNDHIEAAERWLHLAEELWTSAERDRVDPSEALAAAAISTAHSSLAAVTRPIDVDADHDAAVARLLNAWSGRSA